MINVLENRFNIRKEEIEIDRKLKGVRDSIEKAESEFVEIQKDENRERR